MILIVIHFKSIQNTTYNVFFIHYYNMLRYNHQHNRDINLWGCIFYYLNIEMFLCLIRYA